MDIKKIPVVMRFKLSQLNDQQLKAAISDIEIKIKTLKSQGKSDEAILDDLGDLNMLAAEILIQNGVQGVSMPKKKVVNNLANIEEVKLAAGSMPSAHGVMDGLFTPEELAEQRRKEEERKALEAKMQAWRNPGQQAQPQQQAQQQADSNPYYSGGTSFQPQFSQPEQYQQPQQQNTNPYYSDNQQYGNQQYDNGYNNNNGYDNGGYQDNQYQQPQGNMQGGNEFGFSNRLQEAMAERDSQLASHDQTEEKNSFFKRQRRERAPKPPRAPRQKKVRKPKKQKIVFFDEEGNPVSARAPRAPKRVRVPRAPKPPREPRVKKVKPQVDPNYGKQEPSKETSYGMMFDDDKKSRRKEKKQSGGRRMRRPSFRGRGKRQKSDFNFDGGRVPMFEKSPRFRSFSNYSGPNMNSMPKEKAYIVFDDKAAGDRRVKKEKRLRDMLPQFSKPEISKEATESAVLSVLGWIFIGSWTTPIYLILRALTYATPFTLIYIYVIMIVNGIPFFSSHGFFIQMFGLFMSSIGSTVIHFMTKPFYLFLCGLMEITNRGFDSDFYLEEKESLYEMLYDYPRFQLTVFFTGIITVMISILSLWLAFGWNIIALLGF